MVKHLVVATALALVLTACQDSGSGSTRHLAPIPPATLAAMESKGMAKESPIVIRSFKKEGEMEVWKQA